MYYVFVVFEKKSAGDSFQKAEMAEGSFKQPAQRLGPTLESMVLEYHHQQH